MFYYNVHNNVSHSDLQQSYVALSNSDIILASMTQFLNVTNLFFLGYNTSFSLEES